MTIYGSPFISGIANPTGIQPPMNTCLHITGFMMIGALKRMINWAAKIGSDVERMIINVLESRQHPEQAFKVCLGIINLSKKYGDIRLDKACKRSLEFHNYSYKAVKNILEKGLDKIQEEPLCPELLPCA